MRSNHITHKLLTRRQFLHLGGIAMAAVGVLLVGCRPSATGDTSQANKGTNPSASEAIPTATPQAMPQSPLPTQTPSPSAMPQVLGVACAAGWVNDPFPGHCKRYRDSNGNGYCDFSELGSGDVQPRR